MAETARWTAAVRAREQGRPNRLFDDDLAELLAGPEAIAQLESEPDESRESPYVPIRTRFFDDWLGATVRDTGVRQVVLVASGMDSRAFRLDWPAGVTMWELENPELLAVKEKLLAESGAAAGCARLPVGADLTDPAWPDTLTRAGFDPAVAAVWLVEGFLMYLPPPEAHRLLGELSAIAAAGSRLGLDLASQRFFTARETELWRELLADWGTPWLFGSDRPEDVLARHGWRARIVRPGADGANFGRWPWPVPPREVQAPTAFFITAVREGSG